jgi:hypothetical protein
MCLPMLGQMDRPCEFRGGGPLVELRQRCRYHRTERGIVGA